MNWKDVASRAARTFLQAFLGVFLALTATTGISEVPTLGTLQKAGLAALWAGFVAVCALAQNVIEDWAGFGILGKPVEDTRSIHTGR